MEGLSREIFYKKAGEALRQMKKSYRKFFYKNLGCDWSNPENCHPDVPHPQWVFLANLWSESHYQVSLALVKEFPIFYLSVYLLQCAYY